MSSKVGTIKSTFFTHLTKIASKAFSKKYLLITNLTLSGTLTGLGDALQQKHERMTGEADIWDKVRTEHMAISGLSVGFVCHYWYKYLEMVLPGSTLRIVLKKIVADMIVCSPATISTFFITTALLEGKKMDEFIEEVKQKAGKLYLMESLIWPPAQFINFYFLPYNYRILFDNSVSLCYDIYMSKIKHGKPNSEDRHSHRPLIPRIV